MNHIHLKHLHIGPQRLLAITRQKFWILRGRQLASKIVNEYYKRFKANLRPLHQLMENLPQDRLTETRPFYNVGMDFLSPIWIHHKIREKKADKAYDCVFICFSTKVVC